MRKRLVLLLPCIMFFNLANANENLDKSAINFAKAMMNFDFESISKMSHPALIKAQGGHKKYADAIENAYQKPRKNGLRFDKMVFKKTSDIKRYGNITLATMPYTMSVMQGDKGESVSSFYYAFAGPKGLAWFFMDCQSTSEKLLKSLVPGFDNKIKKPGKC